MTMMNDVGSSRSVVFVVDDQAKAKSEAENDTTMIANDDNNDDDGNDATMTEDEKDTLIALQSKRIWQLEQKVRQLLKENKAAAEAAAAATAAAEQQQRSGEQKQARSSESSLRSSFQGENRRRLLVRSKNGSRSIRSSVRFSSNVASSSSRSMNRQSTSCSRRESSDSDDGHRTGTPDNSTHEHNSSSTRNLQGPPLLVVSENNDNTVNNKAGSQRFDEDDMSNSLQNLDDEDESLNRSITSADVLSSSLERYRHQAQSTRSIFSCADDSSNGMLSMSGLTRTQELHAEIHTLNQRLEEFEAENIELTDDIQGLLQDNDEMNNEIKTVEARLQTALDEKAALQKERDDLLEEVERLSQREKTQQPDEMLEMVQDMERQLRRKDKKFRQQQSEFEETVSVVQNEKSDLIDEIYEAVKKKARAEKNLQKYQKQFKTIKGELRQLWQNERAVCEAAKVSARTAEHSHIKAALPASNLVVQKSQQQSQSLRKLLFDLESLEMNITSQSEDEGAKGNIERLDLPSMTMSMPHHSTSNSSFSPPVREISQQKRPGSMQRRQLSDCISALSCDSIGRPNAVEPGGSTIVDFKHNRNSNNEVSHDHLVDVDDDDDDDCSITLGSVTSGVGSLMKKTRTSIISHVSSQQFMKSVAKGGQWFLHDPKEKDQSGQNNTSRDVMFYSEPRGHAHHYMEDDDDDDDDDEPGTNEQDNDTKEKDDIDFSLHSIFSRASNTHLTFNLDALFENKNGEENEEEPSEPSQTKPFNNDEEEQQEEHPRESSVPLQNNDLIVSPKTSHDETDGNDDNHDVKDHQETKDDTLSRTADETELAEIEEMSHRDLVAKQDDTTPAAVSAEKASNQAEPSQAGTSTKSKRKKNRGGRQEIRELLLEQETEAGAAGNANDQGWRNKRESMPTMTTLQDLSVSALPANSNSKNSRNNNNNNGNINGSKNFTQSLYARLRNQRKSNAASLLSNRTYH